MKNLTASIAIICLFIIGLLFHAYQKEWFIILLPYQMKENLLTTTNTHFTQKNISLFFWKHSQWHKEEMLVVWSSEVADNVKTIINTWIILLEDEKLIETDIQVVSAFVTMHKELFLSFNKNIYYEQDATYHKCMIIESLLKTLRENDLSIQSVRFLIHHQPMIDDHLNFMISWPINGYITTA